MKIDLNSCKKQFEYLLTLPTNERINCYLQCNDELAWKNIPTEKIKAFIKDIDMLIKNLSIEKRAKLTLKKAIFYKTSFDYNSALNSLNKAKKLIEENNITSLSAKLYLEYGQISSYLGNFEKALECFKKIIELHSNIDDKEPLVMIYFYIGNVYRNLKSYDNSLLYYNKSLRLSKKLGLKVHIADCYSDLGLLYMMKNDFITSLDYMVKALNLYEELQDESKIYIVYTNMGNLYYFIKDYKKAISSYVKAIVIGNKQKDYQKLSKLYNNLGSVYLMSEDFDKAVVYLKKSADMKRKIHDHIGLSKTLNNLGELYSNQEQYIKAIDAFEKSLKIKAKLNDIEGEITTLGNLAKMMLLKKDYNDVLPYLFKALELNGKTNSDQNNLDIYRKFSDYYKETGDLNNAIKYFKLYADASRELIEKQNDKKLRSLLAKYENERKEKEKEIYHLKNIELKKANATKDRFFSIIAHDLKSPFTTIINFISLMKKRYNALSPEKIANLVDELEKNVNATFSLLENLLTWSKLQSNAMQYNPKTLNIYSIANYVFSLTKFMAKDKGIILINNVDKIASVYADKFVLETIIRNLVTNAIKFTDTDGSITISSQKSGNYMKILVKDTGIGIPSDKIDKLFKIETNFSTYGTRNEKGTGLGLILCKDFAEKSNGSISVKSEEGKGTTFIVKLPLVTVPK